MAGLSRAPLFLLALALALALTRSPAADANANAGRPRVVGSLAEADVKEEGVQQALSFALSEYKASNDAYHSRAMQVVRACKQRGRERDRELETSMREKHRPAASCTTPTGDVPATKVVAAGMNYFLGVKIGRTTCTKSQPNLAACPFQEQPNLKEALCSFQIHTAPWLGKTSLVKSSSKNA
ncbi:unnamed protein product [Pipistrellus nathusii]|uniref:Cystatin domain-containing protein n=1 Tax=Pipistrellus nathusii TaxID=59473 RepID=A0ABP0A3X0_PIPNA